MPTFTLTPGPTCCTDLPPEEANIGVSIRHLDGSGDGSNHDLDLYWAQTPPGRRTVTLVKFDPLTLAGEQVCPCGWSGLLQNGKVI